MTQEIVNNSESGSSVRSKINNNFSELYNADSDLQGLTEDLIFSDVFPKEFFWVPSQSKSLETKTGYRPTFTRSGSAMVLNEFGLWESKGVNEPRFHHRLIGDQLVSAGILLESSKQNVLIQSAALNNAAWTANNITLSAVTSPDGTNNAWSLTESVDGAATFHRIFQTFVLPLGVHTSSIFFKPEGRSIVRAVVVGGTGFNHDAYFDCSNLVVTIIGTPDYTAKIEKYPNNWFRLSITKAVTSAQSTQVQWWTSNGSANYLGDGRLAGYFWCPQFEAGNVATSPILTTVSAVTRAADVCKVNMFELEFPCMLLTRTSFDISNVDVKFASLNDNTSNNVISIGRNALGDFEANVVSDSLVEYNQNIAGDFIDLNDITTGISLGPTTLAAINGNDTTAELNVNLPIRISQLEIGPNLNGCVSAIRIYSQQALADKFIAMTGESEFLAPDQLFDDSYTDYAVLNVDSNSAQMFRDYTFGNYEFSSPGSRIRFNSTHPEVHLLFRTNTPEGGSQNGVASVLVNGNEINTYNMPASSGSPYTVVVKGSGNRLIEFILPYARHVDFLGIRAYGRGQISPPPVRTSYKIAVFGDSITQGFFSSKATKTWAYMLAEMQDAQIINYGFGSSFIDPTAAIAIRNKNPDLVICCTGYNNFAAQTPLASYKASFASFHSNIRATLPTVPIYLGGLWFTTNTNTLTPANYRTQISNLVSELADPNTYYVDTLAAATNNVSHWPDGIHPNEEASIEIATFLDNLIG